MRTWPVGTKIYVISNRNNHNYTIGRGYVVAEVDDDGTFKGRDPDTGILGNWLRWEDVDVTPPIGWEWARAQLPADIVMFLQCFDGIENILLRDDMKSRILRRVPNLYEVILEEGRRRAEEAPATGARPLTLAFPGLQDVTRLEARPDDDTVISDEEARALSELARELGPGEDAEAAPPTAPTEGKKAKRRAPKDEPKSP